MLESLAAARTMGRRPTTPMRPTLLLLLASLCPLQGCCSLARFFCGPDKSEWVSERYDTPRQTVQTLFEAIRRDDAEVVYLCLSRSYRERMGIDGMAALVAWERLKEAVPGLHIAGYAVIPEPAMTSRDRASTTVEVEGKVIDVALERQPYQELRYRRADGSIADQGKVVPSLAKLVLVVPGKPEPDDYDVESSVTVAPFPVWHPSDVPVSVDSIEHAALTHRWKVADVRVRE